MINKACARDLMAPETDPTDEELQLVMREALVLAMERKREAEQLIKQQLQDVSAAIKTKLMTSAP